jgi:hypothetical protein
MSKVSDVNEVVNGSEAIFKLKTVLKSAGWVVQKSSDGSTYNASADEITHAASGAGGMENNYAWFVIRDPGSSHEWCFQRGTANTTWRVKISSLDRFTGGSPDATTVSSATDEQLIYGSGTDASPTFGALFYTDNLYRFHVIAENTAVGSATPIYGFWAFSTKLAIGTPQTLIFQEPMALGTFPELSSGTRAAPVVGDPDPVIYGCRYSSTGVTFKADGLSGTGSWNGSTTANNTPKGWWRMNYGDEAFVEQASANFHCYTQATGKVAPVNSTSGIGSEIHSERDILFPAIIGRPLLEGSNVGLKGTCENIKIKTLNRDYPGTVALSSGAKVYAGDLILPWEDNTIPRM